MRAGFKPDGFYFILSGRVKVFIDHPDGRRFLRAVLGPSEYFGEAELITGAACSENVEAYDKCQIFHIPHEAFASTLMQNVDIVALILRSLVTRLRSADNKIHDFVFLDVYERVARVLLETSVESAGEWLAEPGCEQIAMMVAASREMVSRVLKDMIRSRSILRRRRKIVLIDRAAVEAITRRHNVTGQLDRRRRRGTKPVSSTRSLQLPLSTT